MAFTNQEKIVKAEKMSNQILDTAPIAPGQKFWFSEDIAWSLIIDPQKIWINIDQIPGAGNQAEADTAVTNNPTLLVKQKVRLTLDLTSNNRVFIARSTFNDHSTNIVVDWVPPPLIRNNGMASTGYTIRLYNGDPDGGGTELTTTYHPGPEGAPSWEFSYATGVIKVSTDEADHYKSLYDADGLYIVGYRYIGDKGIIPSAIDTNKVIETYMCESSASIGDIVYFSELNNNTVLVNSNNTNINPSIGVIIEKITATTCKVLITGECDETYIGLVRGKKVYLDTNGKPTSTAPESGYVQCLGVAYAENKLFVKAMLDRTLKA